MCYTRKSHKMDEKTEKSLERWSKLFDLELDRLEGLTRGIDLEKHLRDVQRLTARQSWGICRAQGWDVDELIQDVLLALEIRNQGTCPWDPEKGAMSTYIVRCVKQVISRKLEKEQRRTHIVPSNTDEESRTAEIVIDADQDRWLETQDLWNRIYTRGQGRTQAPIGIMLYSERHIDHVDEGVTLAQYKRARKILHEEYHLARKRRY